MRKISTKFQERLIALGMVMMLCIILVPLLIMGKYNFPCGDDYAYALESGHYYGDKIGLFSSMIAQIKNTYYEWKNWQGTYFQNYVAYLINALCLQNYYYLTPYLTLLPFTMSLFFGGTTILRKCFGAKLSEATIATIPLISLIILYVQCPSEAFYWMCGATLYTTSYSLIGFTIAAYISFVYCKPEKKVTSFFLRALLIVLAFFIGGSAYPSALPLLAILFLLTTYFVYTKHKERNFLIIHFILSVLALLVSICSPGAAKRQGVVGAPLSPIEAVLSSFVEAFKYIQTWALLPVVLLIVSLTPIFLKVIQKRAYRFPLPVLFTLLTFCIYAMHFTPCLYALGMIGAYRILNLYRYSLYILLAVNLFYWLGFIHRKWGHKLHMPQLLCKLPLRSILYTGVAFIVVVPLLYYYGGDTITTVSAIKSLRYGNAQRYYAQFEERLEILTAEENQDIVFEPLDPDVPYLLYLQDLGTDPTAWRNSVTAKYYHQKSVRIRE